MPAFEHFFPFLYKNYDVSGAAAASVREIYDGFQLPIQYSAGVSVIPPSVISDLELIELTDASAAAAAHPIYYYVFHAPAEGGEAPPNEFSHQLTKEWSRVFTTDVSYLIDTQNILAAAPVRAPQAPDDAAAPPPSAKIMEIWTEVKENAFFLEKYSYLEWKILEPLNQSPAFMDFLSIYNICSPALSLILPILLLIIPFFLLKLRGVPITFSIYVAVLRDIAHNTFIGKTLAQIATGITWDKAIYLIMTVFFYGMQMFQNTMCCIRYYRNLTKIHGFLRDIRAFVKRQIVQMDYFCAAAEAAATSPAYTRFRAATATHRATLEKFAAKLEELSGISPFGRIGKMMTCFYDLYKNPTIEASLRYAIGFEAFICHLEGIQQNLSAGIMSAARFDASGGAAAPEIVAQYYPPLCGGGGNPIKNDISLAQNAIITGPNASGKTTTLKTTILNILMTQQFGCGFYTDFAAPATLYTHIHSYLNIPDTSGRDSLFQAEARRCKDILDIIASAGANARHFCIFDELFSGTNPVEATQTAQAFLLYLSRIPNVDFMMTTHYTDICRNLAAETPRIVTYMMETTETGDSELHYTYKMSEGISTVMGAVKVLRMLDYPAEIISPAAAAAAPPLTDSPKDDALLARRRRARPRRVPRQGKNT